jgi:hypothetical protein
MNIFIQILKQIDQADKDTNSINLFSFRPIDIRHLRLDSISVF